MPSLTIPVLSGSPRGANGSGQAIAEYVAERLEDLGVMTETLEPASRFNLPLFITHPVAPRGRKGVYEELPNVQRWGHYISAAPAVVIVSPEYNGGPPANLKLAIDHIGAEWPSKPVVFVTYGFKGGVRTASALAAALKDTLQVDLVGTVNITIRRGVHIQAANVEQEVSQWKDEIDMMLKQLLEKVYSRAT